MKNYIKCNNINEFIKVQKYFFSKNIFWCDGDKIIYNAINNFPVYIKIMSDNGKGFSYNSADYIDEKFFIDYKVFMRSFKFKKLYQV